MGQEFTTNIKLLNLRNIGLFFYITALSVFASYPSADFLVCRLSEHIFHFLFITPWFHWRFV